MVTGVDVYSKMQHTLLTNTSIESFLIMLELGPFFLKSPSSQFPIDFSNFLFIFVIFSSQSPKHVWPLAFARLVVLEVATVVMVVMVDSVATQATVVTADLATGDSAVTAVDWALTEVPIQACWAMVDTGDWARFTDDNGYHCTLNILHTL